MFQFRPFPSYAYFIQRTMLEYCSSGFPHSEIHGYSGYLLLPVAYRSLSRPSSAPDAKAFPLRSFQLDLSNHLLILKVELCRQFNRIFEIVIVTHLYDVPQLKLKIRSFKLFVQKTSLLPCLSLLHYIVQFSRFDLPTAFAARFEDLSLCQVFKSNNNCCLVGPSGLEPPTLRLSVVRSSQLSYGPIVDTCSISLAALYTIRLVHFAASPLPRRPASLGSARSLDDWLLFHWWR
jgi:hypothetical protein